MQNIPRPAPFVMISSNHGTMIVNRNDYRMIDATSGYGVGYQIMNTSNFDQEEVNFALAMLHSRRQNFGDGVIAVDCGANIGVHTVEWARFMYGWGHVHSFEAQEKIFYALAGNVIINNCLNVTARYAAVGSESGILTIPEPNYLVPSSYGSFELKGRPTNEFIGQKIDYATGQKTVPLTTIDSLKLTRLDFLKIDVEGMEEEVLAGATLSIASFKPIMLIEIIKSNKEHITTFLHNNGYTSYPFGINILAIHTGDPTAKKMHVSNERIWFE